MKTLKLLIKTSFFDKINDFMCAHSGIEPSKSVRRFYRVGKKVRKNRIFHHFQIYVHISQKRLRIEACKQRAEKRFIPPLSNCRMCMDPSLTGFYRVGQN